MKTMAIYRQPGAQLSPRGECSFRVWAPLKHKVTLLLPEHNRMHDMQQDADGYWEVSVPGIKPGTLYYYVLDDNGRRPDPASRRQPEGVHGPSAVTDPYSFTFTDNQWKGMALENMIIYELHTGTFTPEGTFEAITGRLPALQELGITAIEIMPAAQFSGTRNWGYDGVYPFALQNTYGGIDDLKKLVNTAHQMGIAVILDVVYNHQGPEGNYFKDFGPYFTDRYKTPWGSAINFDDAWSDAVRNFYIANALMWLDEFHIDGLRLDAVHAYWDSSAMHFVQELTTAVKELEHRTGKKKVVIGEIDMNNPRYIMPAANGGYGLDAQWIDEFHHALHSYLTGETNGYYEDFGKLELLAKSYRDAYVYTGEYSQHRKRKFGLPPEHRPYSQFVAFIQNHDQVGNRMLGERLSTLVPFEALKLSAAALLLSPFVPLLFMGEEYGEKHPFLYFAAYEDQALVTAVREGRKNEFAAFHTGGEAPDPMAQDTFTASKLSWDMESPGNAALLNCYRYLIKLRKERPALQCHDRNGTRVHPVINESLLIMEREYDAQDRLLVILNFGKEAAAYHPAVTQTLYKLFDSAHLHWGGPGAIAQDEVQAGGEITIQPLSAIVYEMK
jgi:maltooligosyltrehalose trehalohydrolase